MYIDIRDKNKYLKGHIASAININYIDLLANTSRYLNKNNTYYIYCDSGMKSEFVVSRLVKKGYNCVNVDGGYNNYLKNR